MSKINNEDKSKFDKREVKLMKILCITFFCLFIGYIIIPVMINLINPALFWNIFDFLIILIVSLLWMVPAYATNALMVVFGKSGSPIDGGRYWNGKRILGNGKTWQGMFGGIISGFVVAMVIWVLNYFVINDAVVRLGLNNYSLNPITGDVITLFKSEEEVAAFFKIYPGLAMLTGFFTSFGTFFGDAMGSFFKRRFGLKRGAAFPIVDQLDFISFAMIFGYISHPIKNIWVYAVFLLIFTPLVHLLANVVAYYIKLKNEPW